MSDVIHVSIGSEPMQEIAAAVLRSSILRRTTRPIAFSSSWSPPVDPSDPEKGWHPAILESPRLRQGTRFNIWRWLVPALYAHRGRAIYLDADQVVLGDIGELWDALQDGNYFAAVTNAVGIFGNKVPTPGAVQTSVMVMDCAACDWDAARMFRKVIKGRYKYADMMQAKFLDRSRIQSLDPGWNHFGICEHDTKLIHWSHVASQPYRKREHPTSKIFGQELHASIRAGHVTRADVYRACGNGGLCMTWGNDLPDDGIPSTDGNVGGIPADAVLRSAIPDGA